MSEAKQKYIAHIKDHYVPLYFRDYYLDVVCDGQWDVCLYAEEGRIAAAYVYMLKKKLGIKYIVQPQLCPYTGPVYFSPSDYSQALIKLIDQLPRHHLIIQDYYFDAPFVEDNPLAQTQKHTYAIDRSVDIDALWKEQSSTHRRIIRKAGREQVHEEVDDMDAFLSFVSATFQKRNKTVPNDPSIFKRLDEVLRERKERKIVKCSDKDGRIVAMCYFMNDEKWTYNFANSVIDDYRHYAMNYILWKEIESTLAAGRSFDFEGSMIPGVDELFRRFKGQKTKYSSIHQSSNAGIDLLVKLKKSR